jgi:hypothetical protein
MPPAQVEMPSQQVEMSSAQMEISPQQVEMSFAQLETPPQRMPKSSERMEMSSARVEMSSQWMPKSSQRLHRGCQRICVNEKFREDDLCSAASLSGGCCLAVPGLILSNRFNSIGGSLTSLQPRHYTFASDLISSCVGGATE